MKLGQSTGVLGGKKVSLGGTPYMADKQLNVPVKFMVAALEGGPGRWDGATKTFRPIRCPAARTEQLHFSFD